MIPVYQGLTEEESDIVSVLDPRFSRLDGLLHVES